MMKRSCVSPTGRRVVPAPSLAQLSPPTGHMYNVLEAQLNGMSLSPFLEKETSISISISINYSQPRGPALAFSLHSLNGRQWEYHWVGWTSLYMLPWRSNPFLEPFLQLRRIKTPLSSTPLHSTYFDHCHAKTKLEFRFELTRGAEPRNKFSSKTHIYSSYFVCIYLVCSITILHIIKIIWTQQDNNCM